MKLGLLTAPFPRSIPEAGRRPGRPARASRCSRSRAGPPAGGERRRYAGTSHIDVVARRRRARFATSSTATGSRSRRSPTTRTTCTPILPSGARANTHLRKVIDAAAKLDVGIVGTFVGRDKTKNVPDNFREFRKVWPRLVDYAESRGVKIAIENCPMIFSWDEWPGGTNLASTPAHLGRDVLDRRQPELRPQPRSRRTSSG